MPDTEHLVTPSVCSGLHGCMQSFLVLYQSKRKYIQVDTFVPAFNGDLCTAVHIFLSLVYH